jgi:hypothetical protein
MHAPSTNLRRFAQAHHCATCGTPITPNARARGQRYCSVRCRVNAWRKDRGEGDFCALHADSKINGLARSDFEQKPAGSLKRKIQPGVTPTPNVTSKPLNILGGHRWPNAKPVDSRTLAKIIHSEIGSEDAP